MMNFTIQYPKTVVTVLGQVRTNKEEWNQLEYTTKVILLGSFVNALVPEYEYCALDFIPSTDKSWEHDINNQHLAVTCNLDDSELTFTLERRTFIPCNLVEV